MGDDEAPSPVAQPRAPPSRSVSTIQPQATGPKAPARDYSAEVGNAKNSLESTTQAVHDLEREKAELEQKENSSAAQLKEIELRLSSVRAQHDNETRIVDDLKRRTHEQSESLTKLRSELISKESELSALRAEKDETEQALLRDKEEVRTMGKRMKEVQEETDKLKSLLEKMKKEARQQRGMVAIAKKQVQTVEVGRDAVQKEMDDVAAGKGMEDLEQDHHGLDAAARIISPQSTGIASPGNVAQAASISLPATPQQVLSPVATGTTSRSNNPFDRLGFGGAAFAKPPASTGAPAFPNAFAPQAGQSAEHASRDVQAAGEADKNDHELSTLEKATLGAGAAVAAVGGIAGAAVATVESAFGVGQEESHERQGQQADVAAGGDTLHEIAQHVKEGNDEPLAPTSDADTSGAETLHEIAQNVKDDTSSEHSRPESIDHERLSQTRATDSDNDLAKTASPHSAEEQPEDPFGMSIPDRQSNDVTPTAETPSARQTDDPFGMPATASTGGFATAQTDNSQSKFDDEFESNFDQGFADDFGKAPANSQSPAGFDSSAGFGNVTSPTADMHLAPASEPKSDFDSAFANAEKPASAVPPQLRGFAMPKLAERTDSTRAVAPSSSVGTPLSEFAPSTPRSMDTASVSDDVRPGQANAFESESQQPPASSAQRGFDAESSDDEAEGPEDLDRSRSPFTGGQYNASPIPAPTIATEQHQERSMSPPAENIVTSPAANPVPALASLGLGAPLDESHDSSAKQAFPQTTESPFFATTSTEKRRDPPPPPPRGASGSQSSNPFASFAADPAPTPASTAPAQFTTSPQQAAPTSSFDDDFDFENLPSAQVAHGQAKVPAQNTRSTVNFDEEFDDFNNDFEEIRPASQQTAQTNNVALASAAPQLPGFDDNFGLSKPVSAQAQPPRNADKGFGFDDDFESAFT